MSPRSQSFFHLTEESTTLEKILTSGGFWPRYCYEPSLWLPRTARSSPHVWFPIVCFCDIPLSRLGTHTATYGEFGLGMTKEWAQRSALHPVAYIDPGGPLAAPFNDRRIQIPFEAHVGASAFMKPITGSQERRPGIPVHTNFYEESEWRHLARSEHIEQRLFLPEHVFRNPAYPREQMLQEANVKTRQHCLLRFEPDDVRYIFVKSEGDIPGVIRAIQGSAFFERDPDATLRLITRIAALPSLAADL